ncbi:hypothetical protein [Maritimibacter sp. UBA3975]|uniref:hypothetical protein n=1 Tax=Maritimibacter sp. UBA3975 TaxID=1946833 RepID=UPI000C095EF5|nr:hypothetical protein [Maritimibacter sp. UBA3975]MAM63080.1 hypothetical protein [Maritimibacter sp.]|tara:strand:- start:31754 stop:32293 length:540 start_codon:yes stop_codon:yes gene_type:complete
MPYRVSLISAAALCVTTVATAQDLTPLDVGAMSREAFVERYVTSYEEQLDWTKEAFRRVDPAFAGNVDAEAPVNEAERAVAGCLYDAADSDAKKEQLGLQLAMVARLDEMIEADPALDYVDVVFGGVMEEIEGFQPSQDLASMMQACNATDAAMQRMTLSPEVFAALQEEAVSRGYLEQ